MCSLLVTPRKGQHLLHSFSTMQRALYHRNGPTLVASLVHAGNPASPSFANTRLYTYQHLCALHLYSCFLPPNFAADGVLWTPFLLLYLLMEITPTPNLKCGSHTTQVLLNLAPMGFLSVFLSQGPASHAICCHTQSVSWLVKRQQALWCVLRNSNRET